MTEGLLATSAVTTSRSQARLVEHGVNVHGGAYEMWDLGNGRGILVERDPCPWAADEPDAVVHPYDLRQNRVTSWNELFAGQEDIAADTSIRVFGRKSRGDMRAASMALCAGRHSIPDAVDGAIFDSITDPTDVSGLEAEAISRLSGSHIDLLNLYVTGLTVALIATINACKRLGIVVVLYHYDRDTGRYCRQYVQ